ncbi:AAA domain-containing protein [Sphingomonas sp. BK036]|uniref:ATP-binding protein n=1 Tax=Sphingomonas sp. BK036 TaxID=2512122 RepID=UPI001029BDF4|nr:ATP-binding protein [Sphingomonas sp. BK036]RZT56972.1 AAA domain-containing protein [Sphingomonas sp. BK036]
MAVANKKPTDVFTPRAAQVNDSMYVHRPKLEERLIDAIDSNKYIVIHGESGNGKTWLYKRVFAANNIHYDVVNLSNALVAGSLDAAFRQKLGEMGYSQMVTQETNTTVGIRPMGMGAETAMKTSQQFPLKSGFNALLERVAYRAAGRKGVLVLDNFESIIGDEDSLKQLGALIISADDESTAAHGVQVVIVGVPGNLKETITRLTNAAPVANRLTEIPEVARMSEAEAHDLIKRGFIDELGLNIDQSITQSLYTQIAWMTDRIAQHIHELGLIVSQRARRNGDLITQQVLDDAVATWVEDSLSSDLAVIETSMNARETRAGRKNQVLYAMGQCKTEDFKYSEIETIVRDTFSITDTQLSVSRILTEFGEAANPIIRRTPKADAWRFVSPKLKMAIRTKLHITPDGKVDLQSS